MSRTGITFEAATEAAFTIQSNGSIPTIDKIRAQLGDTGSNSTISKYLRMWREQTQPLTRSESRVEPPDLEVHGGHGVKSTFD